MRCLMFCMREKGDTRCRFGTRRILVGKRLAVTDKRERRAAVLCCCVVMEYGMRWEDVLITRENSRRESMYRRSVWMCVMLG